MTNYHLETVLAGDINAITWLLYRLLVLNRNKVDCFGVLKEQWWIGFSSLYNPKIE